MADEDWTPWLNRHGPAMLLLARQWANDASEAEDIVQEAFLRFWRLREKAADRAAYLYACVRSVATELRRGGSRREAREKRVARPERVADWFTAAPERAERDARIERLLRDLPPAQREVVVMKLWGRLSFEQVAVALGTSPNTAASRYRYALEKLRAELAEEHVP
jgi:RNA polymerase sigma factor (sigma-70 family)